MSRIMLSAAERRVCRAVFAGVGTAVLTMVVLSSLARAHVDPASDVLLAGRVYYPYQPAVSASLQQALNDETAAAAHAHFPIKVALIDSQFDLGAVPEMFNKPQPYARFLDQELGLILGPHVSLLVVMPDGYGVQGLPPADSAALAGLAKPTGTQSNDLAQAAISAVRKLASAAGHPIGNVPSIGGSGNGGGGNAWTLVAVALAALAIAGGILVTRRRLSASGAR